MNKLLFKILIHYISGYVNILVEGYFVERFINICISKNILLWNMKREKSTILYTNISLGDFKKIKQIAKKTRCRVKIEKKSGLPFLFHKYKKRKIFFLLLAMVFVCLLISSQFVWNIEITGAEKIEEQKLIEDLKACGLETGKFKNTIDLNDIINEIRLKREEIAWIGISINGTNAKVEVVEAKEKPEIVQYDEYCNIISDKEGMITRINVQNGTALVKEGDIVKKGTVLVGGWLEGKYTGVRYVHSIADIQAKVWYSKKKKANKTQQINVKTGKSETKYTISINNFKINLYKTLSKFENYDTIRESKKLKLFSNFYLPIEIEKITNYEQQMEQKTYTEDELKEKLEKEIEEELKTQVTNLDSHINKQVNTKNEEDSLEVEVVYEVLENIGTEEKVMF